MEFNMFKACSQVSKKYGFSSLLTLIQNRNQNHLNFKTYDLQLWRFRNCQKKSRNRISISERDFLFLVSEVCLSFSMFFLFISINITTLTFSLFWYIHFLSAQLSFIYFFSIVGKSQLQLFLLHLNKRKKIVLKKKSNSKFLL